MQPPESPVPDLGPVALLSGPLEVVEGYYELEQYARRQRQDTLTRHQADVELWYRLLTLHCVAFRRGFNFTCPDEELAAYQARMQMLALGVSYSKAALDMLLVGYYSVAFGLIRHLIETWLISRYLEGYPDRAAAYYQQDPEKPILHEPTNMQNVVARLKEKFREQKALFEQAHRAWKNMSKGSHPSGVGIAQTRGEQSGVGVLGSAYQPDLCRVGLSSGLFGAYFLVHETGRLRSQPEAWLAEVRRLEHALFAHLARLLPATEDDDRSSP